MLCIYVLQIFYFTQNLLRSQRFSSSLRLLNHQFLDHHTRGEEKIVEKEEGEKILTR